MFRRDARRQLPSRKTTVQGFVSTFVSMKLLDIFNKTLAHTQPCFWWQKWIILTRCWDVSSSQFPLEFCKLLIMFTFLPTKWTFVKEVSVDVYMTSFCWRTYRLPSQRASFTAFQRSVNLDIFDQGPWHFNICDVEVTISCWVCRRFDEKQWHVQLCLWWTKQELYAITGFCINLARARVRCCHKSGWFNLLKLNLSEWARLKMFITNCHYFKLNLQ